jgi:hypothetical protein
MIIGPSRQWLGAAELRLSVHPWRRLGLESSQVMGSEGEQQQPVGAELVVHGGDLRYSWQ